MVRMSSSSAAFVADRGADIGDGGIVAAAGEVEQHAVRGEILDVGGLQILDRREVAAVEQRHPIIIGADMHAALVGADRGRDVVRRRRLR